MLSDIGLDVGGPSAATYNQLTRLSMPLHTTDALILRTYKLGESDRIVVFLTRDRGKKRGVAKNARQSRRRFGGALEPLTYGRVGYVERERRDLVRLDYVETLRSPLSAVDGEALGYVSYFAELIDEWAQEADPNETLFRLGVVDGRRDGEGRPDRAARALLRVLAAPAAGRLRGRPAIVRGGARVSRRRAAGDAVRAPPRDGLGAALRELEASHRALIAMHLEKELKSIRVLREMRR